MTPSSSSSSTDPLKTPPPLAYPLPVLPKAYHPSPFYYPFSSPPTSSHPVEITPPSPQEQGLAAFEESSPATADLALRHRSDLMDPLAIVADGRGSRRGSMLEQGVEVQQVERPERCRTPSATSRMSIDSYYTSSLR